MFFSSFVSSSFLPEEPWATKDPFGGSWCHHQRQWWGYAVIPPDDTLITNVDFLDTDTRVGFVAGVFEIEALRGVSILYKWAATLEVHFLDQDGDSLGVATSCKCCSAPVGQLGTEICAIGTAVGIMLLARGGRGPRR